MRADEKFTEKTSGDVSGTVLLHFRVVLRYDTAEHVRFRLRYRCTIDFSLAPLLQVNDKHDVARQ